MRGVRSIILVSVFLALNSDNFITNCNKTDNIWMEAGRMTGLLLSHCMRPGSDEPQEQFLLILQRCLKLRSLDTLDRALNEDVIEVSAGIQLVKREANDTERDVAAFNDLSESRQEETDWKTRVLQRMARVFDTHVLKIRLDGGQGPHEEGRGIGEKKRQGMMLQLMIFGIVTIAMIIIPMGFQFLAVLGGKALLLAKMALILTSIQGLKKIAKSNINYGLYATPEHEQWNYDRQWEYEKDPNEQPQGQPMDLLHAFLPRIDKNLNKKYYNLY